MTGTTQSLIPDEQLAGAVDWYFQRGRPNWGFEEQQRRQLTRAYLDKLEPLARQ